MFHSFISYNQWCYTVKTAPTHRSCEFPLLICFLGQSAKKSHNATGPNTKFDPSLSPDEGCKRNDWRNDECDRTVKQVCLWPFLISTHHVQFTTRTLWSFSSPLLFAKGEKNAEKLLKEILLMQMCIPVKGQLSGVGDRSSRIAWVLLHMHLPFR